MNPKTPGQAPRLGPKVDLHQKPPPASVGTGEEPRDEEERREQYEEPTTQEEYQGLRYRDSPPSHTTPPERRDHLSCPRVSRTGRGVTVGSECEWSSTLATFFSRYSTWSSMNYIGSQKRSGSYAPPFIPNKSIAASWCTDKVPFLGLTLSMNCWWR